jgi:hypothetical protein
MNGDGGDENPQNIAILIDYFNELRDSDKKPIWEIANPIIFQTLCSASATATGAEWRLMDEKKDLMLFGLYGRRIQVPFKNGKTAFVYVFAEFPEMFRVPPRNDVEALWEWWVKYGNAPVLVSCPIVYKSAKESYSWTLYSSKMSYAIDTEDAEYTDLLIFYYYYHTGCYGICSGQTVLLGLHRAKQIRSEVFLELLRRWRERMGAGAGGQENLWTTQFNTKTLPILQFNGMNTLIGDHLPMVALYGNCCPNVIAALLDMTENLSPLIQFVSSQNNFYILPYYYRLVRIGTAKLRNIPAAETLQTLWGLLEPHISRIGVETLELGPGPIQIYLLNIQVFGVGIPGTFLKYLEKTCQHGINRFVYRLFDATFMCRNIPRRTLEAHWNSVRDTFFHDELSWQQWVARAMIFYQQPQRETVLPWRFLHWLFHPSQPFTLSLWTINPVLYSNVLYKKNLYESMRDFPEGSPTRLYRDRILRRSIQERLRVLYQFRRIVPGDVIQALTTYVRNHREDFFS